MFDNFDRWDWFVAAHSIFIALIFLIIFVVILYTIIRSISEWRYNSSQPRLTAIAKVVSKRTEFSNHLHENTYHGYTEYFVTFEFETGDRQEFKVDGEIYGYLAEGDKGKLTFQGRKFLGFERN
ncbi:Protein of unknown function [Thermoanaerobacter thermohydrosulfuricus]|uniref:DUF2500 domain-containing protein n=2 Tax=Thermoanaerobacter thermohydrosulfuricus TaxID=1516 RepID=M8CYK5_THETY|nr:MULTISPECIES: DUF2500 domain-containing protein [Thermoanaerobacter]EMT39383.1 Protein of unknown function (DUF2500) [Thermoanaerobacter thermohydrosulfuricus WC1]UZQ83147.1 DUF2500 domain-containing protein [Thermoanaerobacter sp. RKWS2]SDF99155.1 Protein of unknown function [Thermoanaerobacter thermohydrosulfuricus]